MTTISKQYYDELKGKINQWSHHYYTLDNPIATDNEWDELYTELLKIETINPEWVTSDSPSQRVGGEILEGFLKAAHTVPLLSLDKAQNYEKIKKFFDDIFKELGRPFKVSLELKFDGSSVVLRYENGYFVQGRTRGRDGVGEDITAQLKTIKSIPMKVPHKETFEVQGEVYMPLDALEELNQKMQEEFNKALKKLKSKGEVTPEELEKLQKKYKSYDERNVAAGSLRQLDTSITASRKLDAYLYNVPFAEGTNFATQEEMMEFLKDQGFKVNSYFFVLDSYEQVIEKLEEMKKIRPTLNFAIDGMVIKVNEIDVRDEIGFTAKHPKFAIAFKFDALIRRTKVLDKVIDVGRTGKINPVGLVEEVDFDGIKVNRVTLNNFGDILRKNVLIGGEVFIRRSNDVIPEIINAVPDTTGVPIEQPTHCPSCGSELVEVKALLYCKNHGECPAQLIGRFVHFSSREAMNIEGLSDKSIIQLADANLINKLSDLYFLKRESLLALDRFGDKKATNLLNAIENSIERPFRSFLLALGIKNVGKETAITLADYYKSIDNLMNTTSEELQTLNGIRGVVAGNIVDFFSNEENRDEIAMFKVIGMKMKVDESGVVVNGDAKYTGKIFVITGKMSRPRPEIAQYIEENGGKVGSGITKKTDYLVLGEDAGSKKAKAEKLGVVTISEDELYEL